jgi:fatty-acyl-CoA synthase
MDRVPSLKTVLQVFGPGDPAKGVLSFDQSIEQYPADGLSSGRRIEPSEVAAYFHTGGTTGSPKLALHTHANEVYAAWAVAQMWHYRPGEPGVSGLPLFHVAGALVTSLAALAQARALIIPTPAGLRNPAAVENHWKMVERYRPTLIGAVPTSIGALCNVPVGDADISSVQRCLTGGSALPVQVEKDFHRLFGLKVHQMYGSTESSVVATMNPVQGEPKIGSVGIRAPYQELRIVDPAGNGLAAGEVGEIVVRGPNVFPGYKDPAQNRGILTEDGWLHTGDLGYLDPDGFLFVTGRVKDVIIRSAHNIDPAVIEEALMEHPAVEMAAAVGRPDAYAGELPVAYVQLRPGRSADPDELMAFVETRISERPAKPKDIILIDQMPLTGVGKIFKPSLRYEQAERALAAALAPLTEKGAGVEVAVGENRPYGALATITLTAGDGADRPALERETAEIIGRFTMINHQIVWAE